VKEETHVE
jgi:ubiquitin C-terminal hydrolase